MCDRIFGFCGVGVIAFPMLGCGCDLISDVGLWRAIAFPVLWFMGERSLFRCCGLWMCDTCGELR
ncbi:hypothetical protein A0J48_018185 [Sphaerospermopsis aphanizomenoides BCCUSP55]|nr:hypothetical protein [Sphaerospermopsis aphanizomenoides BCCUSP55]